MKECCNLDTRDKENLDSIPGSLVNALTVLRRRTINPSTVAADSVKEEIPEDHLSKFLLAC